jgi:hypothetical protein
MYYITTYPSKRSRRQYLGLNEERMKQRYYLKSVMEV